VDIKERKRKNVNIKILQEYITSCDMFNLEPSFDGLKAYKLICDLSQNFINIIIKSGGAS
jgi:hypothetical protein